MKNTLQIYWAAGACAPEKGTSSPVALKACRPGKYLVHSLSSDQDRLLELGFIPGKSFLLVANTKFGIKVKINLAIYLLNEIVASAINVQPIEE
jgi:Fe2+ transport system protein FeoA